MDWTRIFINALEASIGLQTVVFALAAIGLNVHFGYTGLLNFGQSGFLAVAAYGLAVTVATFNLPMWLGIIFGLLGAVVLALLLGIPTLRLRADYLAIVTIAAAEIIRLIVRSVTFQDTFGGSDGRQAFAGGFYDLNPYPVNEYNIGRFGFNERQMWILTVGWILVALSCLVVYLLCSLALLRLQWTGQMSTSRGRTVPLAVVGVLATLYSLWAIIGAGSDAVLWGSVLLALGAPLYLLVRDARKVTI